MRLRLSSPYLIAAVLAATSRAGGQTGIKKKRPVFGGACHGSPHRDGDLWPMDEQQQLLQWRHLYFSYNVHTVWNGYEVPLHPGAARYYTEKGYMK
jgi:hypothetical protein